MSTGAGDGLIWAAVGFGLLGILMLGMQVVAKDRKPSKAYDAAMWSAIGLSMASAAALLAG